MLMSPNGHLQKHLKFIISLCMVCALLSAVISVSGEADEFLAGLETEIELGTQTGVDDARLTIAKEAKKNMEAEVAALVSGRFGFSENEIYVVVTLNTENLEAVEITQVTVFAENISLEAKIKEYVSGLFEGEAEIVVLKKGE